MKRSYMWKKMIGLLLVLAMVASLLPAAAMAVYAEENEDIVWEEGEKPMLDEGDGDDGGDDDDKPSGGDETPGGSDTTPGGGETPGGDDTTPGGGDETPGGDDTTPGGGDTTPGGDDTTPGGDDETPGSGDKDPDDGDNKPGDGDDKPGDDEPGGSNAAGTDDDGGKDPDGDKKHEHVFNYKASDGTLTATCSGEGKCPLKDNKVSVSIFASDRVYDGRGAFDAGSAGISGRDDFEAATGAEFSSSVWQKELNAVVSDTAPVGTYQYTLNIYVKGKDTFTLKKNFSVMPREVTVDGLKVNNKAYDGTKTATVDTSKVVFKGIVPGDKLSVKFKEADVEFPNKNAGVYTVKFSKITLDGSDAGNYKLSPNSQKDCIAEITRRDISDAVIELGTPLFYNGKNQEQKIRSVVIPLEDGTELKVTYQVFPGSNIAREEGGYTLTINGVENFVGSKSIKYSVLPSISDMPSGAKEYTYGGTKLKLVDNTTKELTLESTLKDLLKSLPGERLKEIYEAPAGSSITWTVSNEQYKPTQTTYITNTMKNRMSTAASDEGYTFKYSAVDYYYRLILKENDMKLGSEAGISLKFTLNIPKGFPAVASKRVRSYMIDKYNGTNATLMDATVNKGEKTLTFTTKYFSTNDDVKHVHTGDAVYAVAYKDSSSVTTGDRSPIGLVAVIMVVALCGLGGLLFMEFRSRRKEKAKQEVLDEDGEFLMPDAEPEAPKDDEFAKLMAEADTMLLPEIDIPDVTEDSGDAE